MSHKNASTLLRPWLRTLCMTLASVFMFALAKPVLASSCQILEIPATQCSVQLLDAEGQDKGIDSVRHYTFRGSCSETYKFKYSVGKHSNVFVRTRSVAFGKSFGEYDPSTGRASFRGYVTDADTGNADCPYLMVKLIGSVYQDEFICPIDPWTNSNVACRSSAQDQMCNPAQAATCPYFGGEIGTKDALALSKTHTKEAAPTQEAAQSRANAVANLGTLKLRQAAAPTAGAGRNLRPDNFSRAMLPPLVLQPSAGSDTGQRLRVEVRGDKQSSKAYDIAIETLEGGWQHRYARTLGANTQGAGYVEINLAELADPLAGRQWRLRTRGKAPETPWSSWVEFHTGSAMLIPTRPGRLKRPAMTDPK